MKIALINHEFPPIVSGIGGYTYDLANNLAKKGIEVVVITGDYKNKDFCNKINNNLKIYRLKTHKLIIKSRRNRILVPCKDSQALTDAIIKILNTPKLAKKMGEKEYKKVKKNFTGDIQVNKTNKILKEVFKK